MQDKQLLITSMQKLIKHIGTNKKNQQDIFKSLSKVDLSKIVSNLQDASTELRKISFELIISLLHDNFVIKKQFCQKLGVGEMNGRIILNPKILTAVTIGIKEIIALLKQPLDQQQSFCTVWYINPSNNPRKIQYLNQGSKSIDPKQNIVGIIYPQPSISLLKQGLMINNLIENAKQTQINSSFTIKNPNNSHLTSYSGSFQSYSKRQPGYSHNYTANTINNYNTHNNYYTIVPDSTINSQVYGLKQYKETQQSKDSLKEMKKDGPISIKKLNAYAARNNGVKQNNQSMNMHQSIQMPPDRTYNTINRSYMANSSIGSSTIMNQSLGYNMTQSIEEKPNSTNPYVNNRPLKPVSVMTREPQRLINRLQINSDRNSVNYYHNNSSYVPQPQIKNKFLSTPIQSFADRTYKTGMNNSLKYYKKY